MYPRTFLAKEEKKYPKKISNAYRPPRERFSYEEKRLVGDIESSLIVLFDELLTMLERLMPTHLLDRILSTHFKIGRPAKKAGIEKRPPYYKMFELPLHFIDEMLNIGKAKGEMERLEIRCKERVETLKEMREYITSKDRLSEIDAQIVAYEKILNRIAKKPFKEEKEKTIPIE